MMRSLRADEIPEQPRYQEMEVILSQDFEKMTLPELKTAVKEFGAVHQAEIGKALHWTDTQYKAWQLMHYCIKKLENQNDAAKVGDVFHSSWGYDQTNTEYYKIVEISKTGKTCKVVQVGSVSIGDKKENDKAMCESIVADPDKVIDSRKQLVRIERSHDKHPFTEKVVGIGEIQLRGSVFIGTDENSSKHLTTLYRVKGQNYRSWYA